LPVSRSSLARSFGSVAELYDRVRLGYSPEAVDRLCAALGLRRNVTVLDLAAGTGKLTAALTRRFDRVIAVEPDEAMRRLIRGVETHSGTAEAIPLPDSSFEAVFVADAFHWFDGPSALAEIARVLRPRGALALIWNQWWETDPPVPDEALDLLRVPFERSGRAAGVAEDDWRRAFPGSAFEPLAEETISEPVEVDAERLVDLYLTTSSIAALSDDERHVLAADLRRLIRGPYTIPLRIELAWTRLAGHA
jgi:SAM-dependent methyltransferase